MESGWPTTLQQAIIYFADKQVALQFLARFRWPDGKPSCPKCGSIESSFLSTRSVWKCKACKKQYSAKSGTIMEDSPIGLDKWLPAIWMLCGCKNGISSYEIARDLGVTQKSAWFLLHRIRLALESGSLEKKLSGHVEADETFVGGKIRSMNLKAKGRFILKHGRLPSGPAGKAIVMGLLERHGAADGGSKARVHVVAKRKRNTLLPLVKQEVEKGSNVYTDELRSYRDLLVDYTHEVIDHTEAYVRDKVIHTNGMENFWSLFKRSLKGTYVSVEPYHLQAYADEQCFRFNNRKVDDVDRFTAALAQIAGKRITFAELTGKEKPLDAVSS